MKPFEVIPAPSCFPLKKGDIVIMRCSYVSTKYDARYYYDLVNCGKGGKVPREPNNSRIDLSRVAAVIRKGWSIPHFAGTANSVEEAVEIALKYREE